MAIDILGLKFDLDSKNALTRIHYLIMALTIQNIYNRDPKAKTEPYFHYQHKYKNIDRNSFLVLRRLSDRMDSDKNKLELNPYIQIARLEK